MNKILLIIQREYLTRVRNKTFILSTILTPLLFAGLITTVTYISVKNVDHETIAVVDKSGALKGNIEDTKSISFVFPDGIDSTNYQRKGFSAILYTPVSGNKGYRLIGKKQLGMIAESDLEDKINKTLETTC